LDTVWLSHVINEHTPLYGGKKNIEIKLLKSIDNGDSCNESLFVLPAHAGTHVDVPYHFINDGKSIDKFLPEEWIFSSITVIHIDVLPDQVIQPEDLNIDHHVSPETEMILVRTGFEKFREKKTYWSDNPILGVEAADQIIALFSNLRAIGLDSISFSNPKFSKIGKKVHRKFLSNNILLFEDLSLKALDPKDNLNKVIALPLRFSGCDGGPCSVLGIINNDI
jgi:arylformamidase